MSEYEDLFKRMAALDKSCTMELRSFRSTTTATSMHRHWQLTITRQDGGGAVVAYGSSAPEAIREGLWRAELQGWHA